MNPELVRLGTGPGRWVVAVTVAGSGIAFLTATVVNVALPAIGEEFSADVAGLQWVVNGYLVTLAALILLGGTLGDRFGRRRLYLIGAIWFGAASLLCAVAPSTPWLIAARALQGVGGALLTPGSLAIIQASFHPDDRSTAIGAWSGLTGIGAALGPIVGGLLVDVVGWRWVFALPVPLVALVVWSGLRHVPESFDPEAPTHLDLRGALLGVLALAGITLPLIQVPDAGWSWWLIAATGVGVLASIGFVWAEANTPEPMLPLGVFRNRQFTAANLVTLTVYAALGGVFFLLVVYLQTVTGYSALAAGAATLPITGLMLVGSAPSGRLARRIGPRIPLTIGPLILAAGMLWMGQIGQDASYLTGVLPPVVVFGIGLVFTVAPVTATALAAVEDRHAGLASGVNNAIARTAQLLAVAALPTIAGLQGTDYTDPEAFSAGFEIAMTAAAVLAAAGAVIAWSTIRPDVLEEEEPEPSPVDYPYCAVDGPAYQSLQPQE